MGSESGYEKRKNRRSRILWQITFLVLTVFILSAGLTWYFSRRATNELVEESKKELIRTEARNMSTTFSFTTDLLTDIVAGNLSAEGKDPASFLKHLNEKTLSPVQLEANAYVKRTVDSGIFDVVESFVVLPPQPPVFTDPMVFVSSNEDRVYESIPESLKPLYEQESGYLLLKDGVPEWGLKGEHLAVFSETPFSEIGITVNPTTIKPLGDQIEYINDFYNDKKRDIDILMMSVIISSVFWLFLITYVILRYLIRTRITQPIDELSDAAERVMDGDLDVEIVVKKGEEFEDLKRAFSEMLKSIRMIMARAFEED
ncbi:MAG: HAMP domain-containing protein [Actinobacteria bacterium]|nr:HAMP domain-containing protein [Actinomycetota bacterium]